MLLTLAKPLLSAVDGENNPVDFDVAYPIRSELIESIRQIKAIHGPEIYLLPLSGMSCGGGIFQAKNYASGCVVGLHLVAPAMPKVSRDNVTDLSRVELDEILIDESRQEICAGASITLDQLNRALADELGSQFKVLGADLTSYSYAAVGATFMTGGMGPQRRYFSDSVVEAAIYNGEQIDCISGDPLNGLAATYGWSGLVSALRCRYCELPVNEIAFVLPINQTPSELADLLQHLAPFTQLNSEAPKIVSGTGSTDLILGLEHVTTASMGPLLQDTTDNAVTQRARQLIEKCRQAKTDGLIFVNGYSDRSVDEFLLTLVDDAESEELTLAGISLEHTEVFNDAEQMRILREAVPYAARTQGPKAKFVYKNHTDATIRLNPEKINESMQMLWQANCRYVNQIEEYFQTIEKIEGQILIYGHLNPYGVDPHNRITLASDDSQVFNQARLFVGNARKNFYCALRNICEETGSIFVGGEKGADSEREIFAAFEGPENSPHELREKFSRQQAAIQQASKLFNWRALEPYQ